MYRKTTEIPLTFSKGHKEMSFATRLGGMRWACDDETSILSHLGRRNQRLFRGAEEMELFSKFVSWEF